MKQTQNNTYHVIPFVRVQKHVKVTYCLDVRFVVTFQGALAGKGGGETLVMPLIFYFLTLLAINECLPYEYS